MSDARTLSGAALVAALSDARERTLAWAVDLSDAQWRVPEQPGINPLAWELAHIAWFAEFWVLRGPHHVDVQGTVRAARPPVHAGPDALLDSSLLAHAQRWRTALPSRADVLGMLAAQLAACTAAVPDIDTDTEPDTSNADALYFHRLALFHEDMHGEALAWLRATLAYPAPQGVALPRMASAATLSVRGGDVHLGAAPGTPGFAFDNEQHGCAVTLADFEIDVSPVTAGAFLRFVEAGGYDDPAHWPGEAGSWRAGITRNHPERWRRGARGQSWEVRWFDQWQPLDPDQPVIHVNAFEAEAYCRWAGRKLPSAAQWEHAALQRSASGFRWGHSVWEWTRDAFAPYPGFEPGPYADYSAPWFGTHRELRGGAFATHARMHAARYRNFFLPQRSDVFAGFRTTARQG